MQVNFDENSDLAVYFDDYDLCSKCKNRKKCPLVQALSQELVILHYADIAICECGLFKQK